MRGCTPCTCGSNQREPRGQIVRRDLRARAADQRKLRAAGEELRRAALVALDVRLGVGEHGSPRRAECRQRQRICRRAGRHREHAHFGAEELAEHAIERIRPAIRTVCQGGSAVRVGDRLKNLSAHRSRVVRLEIAHRLQNSNEGVPDMDDRHPLDLSARNSARARFRRPGSGGPPRLRLRRKRLDSIVDEVVVTGTRVAARTRLESARARRRALARGAHLHGHNGARRGPVKRRSFAEFSAPVDHRRH